MPKRGSPRRATTRRPPAAPRLKPVPNALAARYCAGHEREVRDALGALGDLELHRSGRMAVLDRSRGVSRGEVAAALETLKARGAIEYVAPVLLDPDSQTRQVPTDEIVLRLKPGRTRRTLQTLGASHGLTISRRNEFEPSQYVLKMTNPSGTRMLDVARALDASDDVEFASPNFLTEIKR